MRSRVSYRFQIDSSSTCGRAKTMRKRYDANFFENREKKFRFQTNTDTCGQSLRACLHGGGGPQVGEVTRLSIQSLILM